MTISRSKKLEIASYICVVIGALGFFACWGIGWSAQGRILGRSEFDRPSPERPRPIEMKGRTFYVEKAYSDRFVFAENTSFVFWAIGACGWLIQNREKVSNRWSRSKK